jgi:hypothetical protein
MYLYFINDIPCICGDIRTFTKTTYKELIIKFNTLVVGLQEEGFKNVYSQIKKEQLNILKFEERFGFTVIQNDDTYLLLTKEL